MPEAHGDRTSSNNQARQQKRPSEEGIMFKCVSRPLQISGAFR